MQAKPNLARAIGLLLGIVIFSTLLATIKIPFPEQIYRPFPSEVPDDLRGTYWLLLEGSSGINLPGVHTHFTSPTDPAWVRTESMLVDPEFMYIWSWERNGKIEHQVVAVPGKCYMIGDQNLEITIEEKGQYWEYHVYKCSPFKHIHPGF